MKQVFRKQRGANLALFAILGMALLGLFGASVYWGFQTFLQNEIQKAANTAVLAGASNLYTSQVNNKPSPNPDHAKQVAGNTFVEIVKHSDALKGLGVSLVNTTYNATNDSITLSAKGSIMTSLLASIGIKEIDVTASASARAVKYAAAGADSPVGSLYIRPDGTLASMQKVINLMFPLADNPGPDLYIDEERALEYVVEACNSKECYDLVRGATPIGSGTIKKSSTKDGTDVIVGSCLIDLAKAGVRKATKLRFTHGNVLTSQYDGNQTMMSTKPPPLIIDEAYLFGYATLCPNSTDCPVPSGFAKMN